MKLGCHLEFSKLNMITKKAKERDCNVVSIYTSSPTLYKRSKLDDKEVNDFKEELTKNNIELIVHAPYVINLASFKDEGYEKSKECLKNEISRSELLGSKYLVLHPGAYLEKNVEFGISRIISSLNEVITSEQNVIICLETMSGKGTEVGRNLKEIKRIIDGITLKEKIGVCIDTCHLHDSGYDLSNSDEFIKTFDTEIGLDYLKIIHLNGSLNEKGAKKDKHANIGIYGIDEIKEDKIGFEVLLNFINNSKFQNIPKILETPYETEDFYKEEILAIKSGKKIKLEDKKVEEKEVRRKEKFAYILIGLPRAGKSTWVKENKAEKVIISLDQMRLITYKERFNKEKDYLAVNARNAMLDCMIEQENDLIVDETNIDIKYRKPLVSKLKNKGYTVIGVMFETDVETCKKRAVETKQEDLIPIIEAMNKKYTKPIIEEGFDKFVSSTEK